MKFLLMQSDFYGPVVKAMEFFKAILSEYSVEVLHYHGDKRRTLRDMSEVLQEYEPTYICISAWCYNNMVLKQMLDTIADSGCNACVIVGGWFPNLLKNKAFSFHKRIDYFAFGDGDDVLKELAQGKAPQTILGLYTTVDEHLRIEFRKTDREYEVMVPGSSVVPLSGCSSACKFCSILRNKQNFWKKSIERVEKEIAFQVANNNTHLYLGYDNVLLNKNDALQYASLMEKYNAKFATTGRVDQIDEMTIINLAKSGCVRLDFGIESASERLSKHINKNLTYDMMLSAAEMCVKHKILPFAFIITALPTETEIDRKINMEFLSNSDFILFEVNRYKDYIGSAFSSEIKNFDVLAVSPYYQYETCYGVFYSRGEFLEAEVNYRYTLRYATLCMIEKMLAFFRNNPTELQKEAYWQAIRDATLDTTLDIRTLQFADASVADKFDYWWKAKQFQAAQNAMKSKLFYRGEKYYIDKTALEDRAVVVPF